MAKGRTNQPLVIWVAPQWIGHDTVDALAAQGHTIVAMDTAAVDTNWSVGEPDLILHPAAHHWNDMMFDFLPAALAAARKRKREAQ